MKKDILEFEPVLYGVYIDIDNKDRVVKIFSDLFEQPKDTSILLEQGNGDRFSHAHLYLEKPLFDNGSYNYKYENKEVIERTDEEKQSDIVIVEPEETPLEKAEKRITSLEEELLFTNIMLTDVELTSLVLGEEAEVLRQELQMTNQYMTDLELLVLENIL